MPKLEFEIRIQSQFCLSHESELVPTQPPGGYSAEQIEQSWAGMEGTAQGFGHR